MMNVFSQNLKHRCSNLRFISHSCRILIVGGGSGGCAIAAKLVKDVKANEVIIVEPSSNHFYQPLFTLVGGGVCKLEETFKPTKNVLPKKAHWIQDRVTEFDPDNNKAIISNGDQIEYDFLILALGLETNYDKIPGLLAALSIPNGSVCSNYSEKYVSRTFDAMRQFKNGNAVFTFPNTPVKCPGAPQKICYIMEDYLRKSGKRSNANVIYNTSLPVLFGVKKYADALWKVCQARNIEVNLRRNLIEIRADKNEAVFENLDKPDEKIVVEYSFLHVTPPMSSPASLRLNKQLTNETGLANVDKATLQHVKYSNVFALGDCGSMPNSKTAAAAAAQSHIVYNNLKSLMQGKQLKWSYDGYASCPLVTSYEKCILAEFDYSLQPLETFPIRQDKERRSMYILKKHFTPSLYWRVMLNGYWNGPATMRKILHLNFNK